MVTRKTLKTLYDVLDVEKSASTDEGKDSGGPFVNPTEFIQTCLE